MSFLQNFLERTEQLSGMYKKRFQILILHMKKILIIMAAALVALAPMSAQTRKDSRNARNDAASAARALKKEGYKTLEAGNVETRFEKYFLKVNAGCREVVGTSEGCISLNLAKITALSNAANEYAITSGGSVRGRIVSSASSLTTQQIDNIVASFERLVEKNIGGELIPYVVAYRTKKGVTSARAYCLVDITEAYRAKKEAMEMALAEQKLAEQYGSMVSDWIDEGFEKEGR